MQTRVHKLLILVGEEGEELESRDYKKLTEVIVKEYLHETNPDTNAVRITTLSSLQSSYPKLQGLSPSRPTSMQHSLPISRGSSPN